MSGPPIGYTVSTAQQLSAQLKALRKSRGLTQAALGRIVGVGQSRIAEIEAEPGSISVAQLIHILHLLGARLLISDASFPSPPLVASEPPAPW